MNRGKNMAQISSIDDVLMSIESGKGIPPTPEMVDAENAAIDAEPVEVETQPLQSQEIDPANDDSDEPPPAAPAKAAEKPADLDEYGNEKPAPRVYSQEEADEYANRLIRERLARGNHPQPTPQQQQEAKGAGFEYDANSDDSWDVQLKKFVRQEFEAINHEQATRAQQEREQRAEIEHAAKFQMSAAKFPDFHQALAHQPITDHMALATRGMKDPAAFMYAAAKRAPQELQRISQLQDPVAQMVEMGKLEERMKKAPVVSKTPRPISRTQEDLDIPHKSEKEPSIEDLIAMDNAQKLKRMAARRR
jgi:hypothetical protein